MTLWNANKYEYEYLESFPGVLKIGNFTDFHVSFSKFHFATLFAARTAY